MPESDLLFAKRLFDRLYRVEEPQPKPDVLFLFADLLRQLGGGEGLAFLDGGGQPLLIGFGFFKRGKIGAWRFSISRASRASASVYSRISQGISVCPASCAAR